MNKEEILEELDDLTWCYSRRIGWIGDDCGEAHLMYIDRDGIQDLFEELDGKVDLTDWKREVARLDAILLSKAEIAQRELEDVGGRIEEDIPKERWWWYLEEVIASPQRRKEIELALEKYSDGKK